MVSFFFLFFFLYIFRRINYCRFRIGMNLDFCYNYGIFLGLVSWFLFVWFWFLPSFEWFRNQSLFIVSKQCACSRRVHIEGHMIRFEYCHPDNNSDNESFGSFSYLLQHNSVLNFILWRSVRKSTIILGMKKLRSW